MLYSNKPVYLDKDVDRRPNNSDDHDKRKDPNLTYPINELRLSFSKTCIQNSLKLYCRFRFGLKN